MVLSPKMKSMNDDVIDDSQLLEQLAALGVAESFLEAADADDFGAVTRILRGAGIGETMIQLVVKRMGDFDGRF